jgi:hypothetical protein
MRMILTDQHEIHNAIPAVSGRISVQFIFMLYSQVTIYYTGDEWLPRLVTSVFTSAQFYVDRKTSPTYFGHVYLSFKIMLYVLYVCLVNIFQVSGVITGMGRGNSPYKRRRALLEDPESGRELEVTAWDANVSLMEKFEEKEGQVVTVTNVTTEKYQGSVSVKVTSSMEVEVSIFKNIHVAYFT